MNDERRRTIHYTKLPPAEPGSELAEEWETYRREVGRLLAEGHEGQFVLIKGSTIVGIWDTDDEATSEATKRFLMRPHLIHKVLTEEPVHFGLWRYFDACPN